MYYALGVLLNGGYSFTIDKAKTHKVSIGLQAGAIQKSVNFNQLYFHSHWIAYFIVSTSSFSFYILILLYFIYYYILFNYRCTFHVLFGFFELFQLCLRIKSITAPNFRKTKKTLSILVKRRIIKRDFKNCQ